MIQRPAAQQPPTAAWRVAFGMDDLPLVRRVTARWAAQIGLPDERVGDFVLAVYEVAVNAVLHGSLAARLLLRVAAGEAVAEIGDDGCWQRPPPSSVAALARRGGMGLLVARQVCDEVEIRALPEGTTVLLRVCLNMK